MKEEIDMGQVPSAQDVHDERSKRQVVDNMPEVRELKRKVNRMRLELDNCEEGSQAEKELISKIKAANQQIRDYYDRPLNLRSLLGMNESKTNKNMKKNVVKINENTLRQIVAESVKKVLNENFSAGMNAVGKKVVSDVRKKLGKPYFPDVSDKTYRQTYSDASKYEDYKNLIQYINKMKGTVEQRLYKIADAVKRGLITADAAKKAIEYGTELYWSDAVNAIMNGKNFETPKRGQLKMDTD